jgi:hypothetical protein
VFDHGKVDFNGFVVLVVGVIESELPRAVLECAS